ncbi:MAG TPA: hypothetical protein VIG99_10105 [Myxococcaceae bacterium]
MRRMKWWMVVMGCAVASVAVALPVTYDEGDIQGFPSMTDLNGKLLGKGRISQQVDASGIRVRIVYDQLNGDRIEETAMLSTAGGDLAQRTWNWQRKSGGQVVERYSMNFDTGQGYALTTEGGKRKEQRAKLDVAKGRTFAGIGFVYALRNVYPSVSKGQRVELEGIAFTPKPRHAKVLVRSAGVETVRSGGRSLRVDHVVIHPEVPKLAKAFVDAPDSHLWFSSGRPPQFIRSEIKMQSLGVVRIDAGSPGGAPPAVGRKPPSR